MHLSIILIAVGLALLVRLSWSQSRGAWVHRWQRALVAFLFPPLLLVMTSLAVLGMGHHGTMLWHPVGWLGCHIALSFLTLAVISGVARLWQHWQLLRQVKSYPQTIIQGRVGRILEIPTLFAAQVGVWNPQLVISQGLLQSLEPEQTEAVLKHEEAHVYYRDTLWFFGLDWVRRITFWLPKTEALWQELLLLREIRADHWASQNVDALTLAESLLLVVQSSPATAPQACTAFHDITFSTRLEERIDFLLTDSKIEPGHQPLGIWLVAIALPLLTLPFHG